MTGIDTDVQEVQKMFNVNVFGPMRMVKSFHPLLVNARGTVVNIGSVGGIVPYVYGCMLPLSADRHYARFWFNVSLALTPSLCAASYNATKAALHHWGNTLRVEMAPLGSIAPMIDESFRADVSSRVRVLTVSVGTHRKQNEIDCCNAG